MARASTLVPPHGSTPSGTRAPTPFSTSFIGAVAAHHDHGVVALVRAGAGQLGGVQGPLGVHQLGRGERAERRDHVALDPGRDAARDRIGDEEHTLHSGVA